MFSAPSSSSSRAKSNLKTTSTQKAKEVAEKIAQRNLEAIKKHNLRTAKTKMNKPDAKPNIKPKPNKNQRLEKPSSTASTKSQASRSVNITKTTLITPQRQRQRNSQTPLSIASTKNQTKRSLQVVKKVVKKAVNTPEKQKKRISGENKVTPRSLNSDVLSSSFTPLSLNSDVLSSSSTAIAPSVIEVEPDHEESIYDAIRRVSIDEPYFEKKVRMLEEEIHRKEKAAFAAEWEWIKMKRDELFYRGKNNAEKPLSTIAEDKIIARRAALDAEWEWIKKEKVEVSKKRQEIGPSSKVANIPEDKIDARRAALDEERKTGKPTTTVEYIRAELQRIRTDFNRRISNIERCSRKLRESADQRRNVDELVERHAKIEASVFQTKRDTE